MTKMRSMIVQGPAASGPTRGQYSEFDPDGMTPIELDTLLRSAEHVIQVWRNGGWRDASIRDVPGWQRTADMEVDVLRGKVEQLRVQAQRSVDAAEGRLASAKAAEEAAKRACKAAEDDLKSVRSAQRKSEAEASEIERERAAAEKERERRLAVLDAQADAEPIAARA
jgi:hypothetical protein